MVTHILCPVTFSHIFSWPLFLLERISAGGITTWPTSLLLIHYRLCGLDDCECKEDKETFISRFGRKIQTQSGQSLWNTVGTEKPNPHPDLGGI
jgi:hypothetical protein